MTADPALYDLVVLAAALEEAGCHPRVVEGVRRAIAVASAHQDLSQAEESLETLMRLTKGVTPDGTLSDMDLGTVAAALLTTAITLYARATDTKPIGRRKWFSAKRLEPDLRSTHRFVMALRNKEVAHFGRGTKLDGSVAVLETVVLRPHDRRHPIGFLSSRAQNKARFTRRFAGLVRAVVAIAERAAGERFDELHRELEAACTSDPALLDEIGANELSEPRLIGADRRSGGKWQKGEHVRRYSTTEAVAVPDPAD